LRVNPIRKVVNLLQQMQKTVSEEGEKEAELYAKFECYCKRGSKDLEDSIAAAEEKIEALGSDSKAAIEKKAKLEGDLKKHKADREAAIKAIKEATAIREKEASAYAKVKAEQGTNAAALEKAIKALERGMGGGAFLQTRAADRLRGMAKASQIDMEDRETLLAFLSGSAEYAPQSGQITGILKQLHDEMAGAFKEATEAEEEAIKVFEELMAAKKEEKKLASEAIETKTAQVGELGVKVAEMENDLEDTQEAMAADKKFVSELETSCKKKAAEWEERKKVRAEELLALADTIKVLNDDDALDLFGKTLPKPGAESFLQVQLTAASMRARAAALLKSAASSASDRTRFDAIFLALHGKKVGFEKVIAMIDGMVSALAKEQKDDDTKKEYCAETLDKSDDTKKELERKVSDLEAAIAAAEETIAQLTSEIAALSEGIRALDKAVAEATENRKAENAEYKDLMASNSAAKEVILFAKNRLNKFYNPKLYKSPPKTELSAEDRIASSMSGTEPPTAAPGGIAGTGITALVQIEAATQAAPPPPPETFGAYQKKGEESNGVMAMMDLLVRDLDKEMTVAEAEEKNAQEDYEELMKDSAEKRTADSKSLSEKEAAKADSEALLGKQRDDKTSTEKELSATLAFIQSLHTECDFIMKYHEVRKEARASETDALGKAKAVLSGADYSLLQTSGRGFLHRRMA